MNFLPMGFAILLLAGVYWKLKNQTIPTPQIDSQTKLAPLPSPAPEKPLDQTPTQSPGVNGMGASQARTQEDPNDPKVRAARQEAYTLDQMNKNREAAFKSEESARRSLAEMNKCIVNSREMKKLAFPPGTTAAQYEELSKLPLTAQVKCIRIARDLLIKFPALEADYNELILKQASPGALELARKSEPEPPKK